MRGRSEGGVQMFQIDDELKALAAKVIADRKDLKRLDTPECRVAYL